MLAGYQLAFLATDNRVVAVAGFRISQNLAYGKFLYVDDLVVDETARSHGYGKFLIG
jgi:ribosomal protein S18 acetylase RimI-like enzyme